MVSLIWVAVLFGFAAWWMLVYALDKAGVLSRYNVSAYGPLIMWRTYRGQGLLDALASPKTFWKAIITLCIPLVFVSMALMLIMIVTTVAFTMVKTPAPGPVYAPQNILAIPGVNEFIPFVWGWIALVVAMLVHEFGHAIMAKAENIKVKSLGVMLLPIPVGAFAEIDEEEMFGTKAQSKTAEILGPMDTKMAGTGSRKASSMALIRILSAGVIANFLVGFIAFALLFGPVLGAVAASNSELIVVKAAPGSPAYDAGMQKNMIIRSVDGKSFATEDELNGYIKSRAGASVTITGVQGKEPVSYTVPVGDTRGIYILDSNAGEPAQQAGIVANTRILGINGTPLNTYAEYSAFMANTTPGQVVTVDILDSAGSPRTVTATLDSGLEPKGYLGFKRIDISDNPLGIAVGNFDAQGHLAMLQGMMAPSGDTLGAKALSVLGGLFLVWVLPVWEILYGITGFNIFDSDLANLYHPVGWAAPLGDGIFYLVLSLFWIGWLNLNVGVFNCLPMIPLDGGHIFREVANLFVGRFVKDAARVEQLSKAIVNWFAIILFSSLVFVIVAPYIVHSLI